MELKEIKESKIMHNLTSEQRDKFIDILKENTELKTKLKESEEREKELEKVVKEAIAYALCDNNIGTMNDWKEVLTKN